MKRKTLIVVPAYNEREAIGALVAEINEKLDRQFHCLIVDDGSTDDTFTVAAETGATVARLPFNLGVGGAMRFGFRYARRYGYEAMVQLDGDGQHDPAYVPRLVAALGSADIVIGSRFLGQDDYEVRGLRKLAMRILARLLTATSRTELNDVTSGFKAMGSRAINLFAEDYPSEYLGDTIEAIVIASRSGLTLTQVPVAMRQRVTGAPSHGPVKSAVYLFRAMLAYVLGYLRPKSEIKETR